MYSCGDGRIIMIMIMIMIMIIIIIMVIIIITERTRLIIGTTAIVLTLYVILICIMTYY